MCDYLKIEFEDLNTKQKEIVITLLNDINFEGFEKGGDLLKAYIYSDLYNEDIKKCE